MRKTKKFVFAALAFSLALGGGIASMNFASAQESAPTLTALTVEDGMSIRTTTPEGLRFTATIAYSDTQYAEANIAEIGMVLMPESAVTGELTVDEKKDGAEALLIPTVNWVAETDENSKKFHSVLVANDMTSAFPEAFYNTPISARAYVKYTDDSVKYSVNTVTRSIGYVAGLYYLSGAEDSTNEVITKIASSASKQIAINDGNALEVKGEYQATLKVGGVEANDTEDITVSWSKEGDAVTVDENGKVKAVSAGTATVKATVSYNGGGSFTVEQNVTVNAGLTEVKESLFAIKQTNDNGEVVTNNYVYEISDENVTAVTLDETTLSASDYTVESNVLTVKGEAFASCYGDVDRVLTIVTASEKVEVTFDKIATFAITKASDMNPNDSSVIPTYQKVNGMNWTSDPNVEGATWSGYTVLANDIDFGGAIVKYKVACANAYGGTHYGFKGIFDGQGYTIKNFQIRGQNVSFFGRSDFNSRYMNVRFENFRNSGYASFGIFDATCYATLDNVYVEATADTTTNGGVAVGKFYTNVDSGARLINSTIIVRVGAVTESSYAAFDSATNFLEVKGSTIKTQYKLPASLSGIAQPLEAGEYYAMKVNEDDTATGNVKSNDFAKEIGGASLVSVTLQGRNAVDVDFTANAELLNGKVVIPASALANYMGRGITLKVVTDTETKYFYQDIVTYAITSANDINVGSGALPKFAKAGGATTYNGDATANFGGYIILGNDIDFQNAQVTHQVYAANWYGAGTWGLTGVLDGRGHTLSNFEFKGNTGSWRSMFGCVTESGTAKNIRFVNYTRGAGLIGGLFEYCKGTMDNIYVDCTMSGHTTQGSIIGYMYKALTNSTIIVRGDAEGYIFGAFDASVSSKNTVLYTNLTSYRSFPVAQVKSLSELTA